MKYTVLFISYKHHHNSVSVFAAICHANSFHAPLDFPLCRRYIKVVIVENKKMTTDSKLLIVP